MVRWGRGLLTKNGRGIRWAGAGAGAIFFFFFFFLGGGGGGGLEENWAGAGESSDSGLLFIVKFY